MTSYMFSIAPYIFIPCFTFWTNDSCTETHSYILFSVRSTPEFTPDFSEVRVTRSLVLCVCIVDRCLSFFFWALCCLSFIDLRFLIPPLVSFGHCVVCPSSIYGFWFPLWYLLAIVLSVLHRFTDSDSPIGIFKLLLLSILQFVTVYS
jgi:hypothetical protein